MINRRQFSIVAGVAAAGAAVTACTSQPATTTTDGPPVILLHGWPYDIHSYVDVAPLLAASTPVNCFAPPAWPRMRSATTAGI